MGLGTCWDNRVPRWHKNRTLNISNFRCLSRSGLQHTSALLNSLGVILNSCKEVRAISGRSQGDGYWVAPETYWIQHGPNLNPKMAGKYNKFELKIYPIFDAYQDQICNMLLLLVGILLRWGVRAISGRSQVASGPQARPGRQFGAS